MEFGLMTEPQVGGPTRTSSRRPAGPSEPDWWPSPDQTTTTVGEPVHAILTWPHSKNAGGGAFVPIGTPDQVAETLAACEAVGVSRYYVQFVDVPDPEVLDEAFAAIPR